MIRAWDGMDARLSKVGQFWQYKILAVAAGQEGTVTADLTKLKAVVVPDRLLGADRYLHADLNYALSIKPLPDGTIPGYQDLVLATNDYNTREFKKQIYYLTDQNKADALELLKLILSMHIRHRTRKGHETHAKALRNEIQASTELNNCKKLMEIYFDMSQHWSQEELDRARKHNVDYRYHPDHIIATNV
jgi:hypothetical protein